MSRTKLADRKLPDYSRGEEVFNMTSHIVGGAFGISVFILNIVFAVMGENWWGLAGGMFYGLMMVFLYTMSSLYHGLKHEHTKKVFQVLDHCTIYALIIGTYMPILATGMREHHPVAALVLLCVTVSFTALGVVFTAIDFKKYAIISYGSYFVIGWSVIFALKPLLDSFGTEFFLWILSGGIAYTSGMIFYGIGKKKKYFHSVFHIFILLGSVLQFVGIFKFCIL